MNTHFGPLTKALGWFLPVFCYVFFVPVHAAGFTSIDHLGEWCEDIGVARPGSTVVVEAGKAYDISGYGSEYGFHCREDQGRFVYTEIAGDFDVHVQVAEIISAEEAVHKHGGHPVPAGAVLMARMDKTVGSPFVGMYVMDTNDEKYPDSHYLAIRKIQDGSLFEGHGSAFDYGYINPRTNPEYFDRKFPNVWLRLRREGNEFSGWTSKNGTDWVATSQASFTMEMPHTILVGMAVSPAAEPEETVLSTVRFRNLSGFPDPIPEGLEITRNVVRYKVEGESARDLLASMRRSGPQNGGRRFFAYHEWDLHWASRYISGRDGCRMEEVSVELTSTTTLPQWSPPSQASEGLEAQWKEFMATLEEHERGHEAIVEAGARELLRSLKELRVDQCEQMDATANDLVDTIVTALQEEDRTYDQETRDGATQGAVWPPRQSSRRGGSN